MQRATGTALRQAREDAEVTQDKLARHIGRAKSSIHYSEEGQRGVVIHEMLDWAEVLQVNPHDLLDDIILSIRKAKRSRKPTQPPPKADGKP